MTNDESVAAEAVNLGAETPLFRALVENLDQCAYLLDARGRHVAVNRHFCEWLDRPETDVVGRTVCDLWPRPLAERLLAEQVRVLRGERLEHRGQWPRGRQLVPVRAVGVPVLDDRGRVRGQLMLFGEVPEGPPDERRQAARLEALGRLTAGAAHDFNNLLTLVRTHLAQGGDEAEPAGRGHVEILDRVLRHGTELAQQMLALARKESPEWRPVDLNAVATDVAALLRARADAGLQVETNLRPGLAPVLAAPGQMARVLLNLCANARDAMPQGGRLAIETDEVLRGCSGPDGRSHGPATRFVCLRVRDTGAGMSPQVQERIFDPFFTTKPEGRGTGLGLAVVAEVVRLHGGWIECDSVPGSGTRFEVFLPAAEASPAAPSPAPGPSGGKSVRATVLLVDNDLDVLGITRTILEREGYRVLAACDGREALEVYRREGPRIDAVLLDRNMPEVSGEEVLAELRRLDPDVRVVLASGYALADLDPQTQAQIRGFLAKPYRPADLLRAIAAALAKKEG